MCRTTTRGSARAAVRGRCGYRLVEIASCPALVDLDQYYDDLERGRLPAVAYIAPAGASEHPPGRIAAGATLIQGAPHGAGAQQRLGQLGLPVDLRRVGRMVRSRSAAARAGFRVPALLVSPYARRGFVDGTPLDTTSIPASSSATGDSAAARFRRAASGGPSTSRARHARRSFPLPNAAPAARRGVRPWVIYLGYGAALALGHRLDRLGRALRRTLAVTRCWRPARRPRARAGSRHDPDRPAGAGHAVRAGRSRVSRRTPRAERVHHRRPRAGLWRLTPTSGLALERGSTAGTPVAGSPR